MYKCYYCGAVAVNWQNDYSADEYGYLFDGIVKTYACGNCGADYEVCIEIPGCADAQAVEDETQGTIVP